VAEYGRIDIVFDHFPQIAREAEEKAQKVVDKTTFDLQAAAQQNIVAMGAVDLGALLNSGYSMTSKGSDYSAAESAARSANPTAEILSEVDRPGKLQGIVAFLVLYAIYVHDGARGRSGRPFLALAAEALRNPFFNAMKDVAKP